MSAVKYRLLVVISVLGENEEIEQFAVYRKEVPKKRIASYHKEARQLLSEWIGFNALVYDQTLRKVGRCSAGGTCWCVYEYQLNKLDLTSDIFSTHRVDRKQFDCMPVVQLSFFAELETTYRLCRRRRTA
jgi:hypothetical protein